MEAEKSAEAILSGAREHFLDEYRSCLRAVARWNNGRDVGVTGELVGEIKQLRETLKILHAEEQASAVLVEVRERFPRWNGEVRGVDSSSSGGVGMTAGG